MSLTSTQTGGHQWWIDSGGGGAGIGQGNFAIFDNTYFQSSGFNLNAARLVVNSSGFVGIGTSTPQYQLTATSATAPQLSLGTGSAGVAQWTLRNAGGNLYFASTTVVGTATTTIPAFSINGNGNVGIGTSSPWALLSVATNGLASQQQHRGIRYRQHSSTSFEVLANGNVRIGTTTNATSTG